MASFKTDFAQLPGLKMHYARAGKGANNVLFVHGYSSTWQVWSRVMKNLPKDFGAIALDVRGSGDSDKPETGHTIEQMSEDVYQFTQALDLKDFTMVGHSMGGVITMKFALEHPELLKSIVMVNPAPADGLEMPAEEMQQSMSIFKSGDREVIAELWRTLGFASDAQMEQAIVDEMVEDVLKASEPFLDQAMADMGSLRIGDRLSEIDLPALMIHGDRDNGVPLTESIKSFELISGCSLQVFYGCGHYPQLEIQEDFTRLLISFVRNPRRRIEEAG